MKMPINGEDVGQSLLQMGQKIRSKLPMNRKAPDQSFPKLIKGDASAQHNN
jgi:hypothetical protein